MNTSHVYTCFWHPRCLILTYNCEVVSGASKTTPGLICWEDSQESAHSRTNDYDLLQWKDTKQNQQKERNMRQSPAESTSFQEASPSRVTRDALIFPSYKWWQHIWNDICQESSLKISVGFLLGDSHILKFQTLQVSQQDFQRIAVRPVMLTLLHRKKSID